MRNSTRFPRYALAMSLVLLMTLLPLSAGAKGARLAARANAVKATGALAPTKTVALAAARQANSDPSVAGK